MKVILSEAAWSDMLAIGQSIAAHSRSRADIFLSQLYDRCQELGHMPFAFAALHRHKSSGIRRRVHGNYLIFYRVTEEAVEILHVLHGAMDYDQVLFPDEE